MNKFRKEMINRRLKHVKPPEEIKRKLTRFLDGQSSKKLLKQWIEIDPIVALNDDGTKAKYEPSIKKHWLEVCKRVTMPGYWMEMGVRGGRSVAWMLEEFPNQELHGFDSWEGLPEEWFIGGSTTYRKGDMNVDMPIFPDNIKLYKGWFKDSLPKWRQDHKGPIALLHIDSDLYSSCKTTLEFLNDQIVPGTIIAFDELCNFRLTKKLENWYEHEWKALTEWLVQYHRVVEPITRNYAYQGACVVIE